MGRKGDHGGHHGGAWKVAYADFVTAMMALFIVLWILSSNEQTQAAVAAYFQHPGIFNGGPGRGYLKEQGVIELREKLERIREVGASDSAAAVEAALIKLGQPPSQASSAEQEKGALAASARELERIINGNPMLREIKGQVHLEFTPEGLRIQLQDLSAKPLFAVGSAEPTETGRELLRAIGRILAPLPNAILVEGHTDSRPYSGPGSYSNWELSGDRANAARRLLEAGGLDPTRIARVVGLADRRLLVPEEPFSEHNRRISITVAYSGHGGN